MRLDLRWHMFHLGYRSAGLSASSFNVAPVKAGPAGFRERDWVPISHHFFIGIEKLTSYRVRGYGFSFECC